MNTRQSPERSSESPRPPACRATRASRAALTAALLVVVGWRSVTTTWANSLAAHKALDARKPVAFAVMSDIHFYDTRLGTAGQAFQEYLNLDPKLLVESEAIFDAALQAVEQRHVRFLIIPGDLTKDGELFDHVRVAQRLAKLEQHGIQVYVVPGNHDINNPDALSYRADPPRPVPTVSPRVFEALYQRFGYGQALDRDRHSLSYVAEPVPGLWLLGVDTCKYQQNEELGTPVIGGQLTGPTLAWVLDKIREAQARGKQVIAFMHHGVNQHFLGEAQLFPDYLVDDWPGVSMQLAQAGLRVVFTGHYHSQDAAYLVDQTLTPLSPLCDVETGSLVLYPCAFRFVTLDPQGLLHIESQRVTEIEADTGGVPFQDYALNFAQVHLRGLVTQQLSALFGLPEEQAAQIAPLVEDALIANYAGDEAPSPQLLALLGQWIGSPEPMHTLGLLLWGIWTDLPPGDNELVIPVAGN